MLVSVIVPVRDDVERLLVLLERLRAQSLSPERFEIVVGDDGSSPRSLSALTTANGLPTLRVTSGPPLTSYAARNRAARMGRGAILAFCDSDCLPDRTWLEEGLAALGAAELAAGEVVFIAPARPTAWSLLTMDMFLDQRRNVLLSRAVTANLFVRRPVFDALGGFDESLPSGGDYDFVGRAIRCGARLVYAPSAVLRHPTLDDQGSFLGKVWTTNRWSAFRRARAGRPPGVLSAITFVPLVGVAFARRNALRPVVSLQRDRLRVAGLRPGLRHDLRALPVLYLLVAYVGGVARVRGWLEGARARRQGGSRYAGPPDRGPQLTS